MQIKLSVYITQDNIWIGDLKCEIKVWKNLFNFQRRERSRRPGGNRSCKIHPTYDGRIWLRNWIPPTYQASYAQYVK